jgi:hypothetical protein
VDYYLVPFLASEFTVKNLSFDVNICPVWVGVSVVIDLAMAATLSECLGAKCHFFCPEVCITDNFLFVEW